MDSASPQPPVDPSESRAFQRWLQKAGKITGIGLTAQERDHDREEVQHRRCEKWKTELLNYSSSHHHLRFLIREALNHAARPLRS